MIENDPFYEYELHEFDNYFEPSEVDKRLTKLEGDIANLHEDLLFSKLSLTSRECLIQAIRSNRHNIELNLSIDRYVDYFETYCSGLENLQ